MLPSFLIPFETVSPQYPHIALLASRPRTANFSTLPIFWTHNGRYRILFWPIFKIWYCQILPLKNVFFLLPYKLKKRTTHRVHVWNFPHYLGGAPNFQSLARLISGSNQYLQKPWFFIQRAHIKVQCPDKPPDDKKYELQVSRSFHEMREKIFGGPSGIANAPVHLLSHFTKMATCDLARNFWYFHHVCRRGLRGVGWWWG